MRSLLLPFLLGLAIGSIPLARANVICLSPSAWLTLEEGELAESGQLHLYPDPDGEAWELDLVLSSGETARWSSP